MTDSRANVEELATVSVQSRRVSFMRVLALTLFLANPALGSGGKTQQV